MKATDGDENPSDALAIYDHLFLPPPLPLPPMAISTAARYRRVTAGLDERAKQRLWSRGGGCRDHAEGASPELADLVDSFYGGGGDGEKDGERSEEERRMVGVERMLLVGLLGRRDEVERKVVAEVEAAVGKVGVGGNGVEKKVVWWLRRRGFDAGLCQSKPEEKNGSATAAPFPSQRRHLYIDVVASERTRYIVELNLAAEFEIARPTPEYQTLLASFPRVFVGRPEKLREVVRLLCRAAANSMRSRGMHVPPWRKKEYVQVKWLGPYERCTGLIVANGGGGAGEEVVVVRRVAVVGCREELEFGGDGRLPRTVGGKLSVKPRGMPT